MFTKLDNLIASYRLNKDNNNPVYLANGGIQHIIDDIENELRTKVLPHGSGIDCEWNFKHLHDLTFNCYNTYHAIDQNGYYCGYVDFIVKIDLLTKEFDVEVNQEDINNIIEDYNEYIDRDDVETNAPYLDDLDEYLYQSVDQELQSYSASESINYLAQDQFYRILMKRAIEEVESAPAQRI